jgi:hypothetical protein
MGNRLATLKRDFEQLFRRRKKHILVDEVGLFVSGCGCQGLRIRPGGLRAYLLDSQGQQVIDLLIDTCSQYGITPNLGYVQMVFGSRDLIDCLYMVDACPACRLNLEESNGLAPMALFYDSTQPEHGM